MFARNNAAGSFALLDQRGKGFRFFEDGSADFISFNAVSDLAIRSKVSEIRGNRICIAPAGAWGGACIELFGSPDGPISVQGEFSNGTEFDKVLRLSTN